MMKWKNPKFNSVGTIDCEILYPEIGWVPYTCDPNEVNPLIENSKLFDRMKGSAEKFSEVHQTHDDIKRLFRFKIQSFIDSVARSRDYDSGTALAGYVASSVSDWKREAEIFVSWRDKVWIFVFDLLDDIESGKKPIPSNAEEIVELLPKIDWNLEAQSGVE